VEEIDEHFHSIHGSVQESKLVFIQNGLMQKHQSMISVLEIGFGTGLNALLTLEFSIKNQCPIVYHAIELFPLQPSEYELLNFNDHCNIDERFLKDLHQSDWDTEVSITSTFKLRKCNADIASWKPIRKYDLVYFDAFAPEKQPELWNESIFETIFDALNDNAILTTYCAKGVVRRTMQSVGFTVERLEGPPGKREMLRATKPEKR